MSARVVHFEVPFDDADRALSFYRDVFDWQIQSMPDMGYNIVATGPLDDQGRPTEPGYIGGGMLQRQAPVTAPVVTLEVADIDATLATIEKHGGSTVQGRQAVGEMGFSAYFTDSEGNVVGLWESAG
jgi:predicted enzyme related to lactoylglutathione lyase